MRSQYIDVEGVRTHVLDAGHGPLVVLLHGAGLAMDSRLTWLRQFKDLARDHRVVAFDQIGFGLTDMPEERTYPGRAARVPHAIATMKALGLCGGTVVGHSEGGFIAAVIAISEPGLVGRLAMVTSGSSAPMFDDERDAAWIRASAAAYNYVLDEVTEERFVAMKRASLGAWDSTLEDVVRENFRTAERSGQRDIHRHLPHSETDMRAYMSVQKTRLEPYFQQIKMPTMLIWAGEDATVPVERGLLLARHIPGADLHVLAGAGHYVMHDRASSFNTLLRSWN